MNARFMRMTQFFSDHFFMGFIWGLPLEASFVFAN